MFKFIISKLQKFIIKTVVDNIRANGDIRLMIERYSPGLKLSKEQAQNLARTLDPIFKEIQRNGDL